MGFFKSRRDEELEAQARLLEAEAKWLRSLVELQNKALWKWKTGEYQTDLNDGTEIGTWTEQFDGEASDEQ